MSLPSEQVRIVGLLPELCLEVPAACLTVASPNGQLFRKGMETCITRSVKQGGFDQMGGRSVFTELKGQFCEPCHAGRGEQPLEA